MMSEYSEHDHGDSKPEEQKGYQLPTIQLLNPELMNEMDISKKFSEYNAFKRVKDRINAHDSRTQRVSRKQEQITVELKNKYEEGIRKAREKLVK
jgi:hypothetical protein